LWLVGGANTKLGLVGGVHGLHIWVIFSASKVFCCAFPQVFYDNFDENWDGRWIVSQSSDYGGKWKYEKSEGHEDYGLLVSEPAKKYGIAADLAEEVDPKDGTVVLQYDLRLQKGLECGGAYLKYLLPQVGWDYFVKFPVQVNTWISASIIGEAISVLKSVAFMQIGVAECIILWQRLYLWTPHLCITYFCAHTCLLSMSFLLNLAFLTT
jgi:hypothetical protein